MLLLLYCIVQNNKNISVGNATMGEIGKVMSVSRGSKKGGETFPLFPIRFTGLLLSSCYFNFFISACISDATYDSLIRWRLLQRTSRKPARGVWCVHSQQQTTAVLFCTRNKHKHNSNKTTHNNGTTPTTPQPHFTVRSIDRYIL